VLARGIEQSIMKKIGRGAFMKIRVIFISSILLLFIFSLPAGAQVYKWQDEKGVTHFSDSPPQGKGALKMKVRESEGTSEKAVDLRQPTNRQSQGTRSNQDIKVVMYMTTWCGYCNKAREYLRSLGVNVTEYDIEKNAEKREEMRKLGGRGVPVINVEGIIIKGYSQEMIKNAVEKRKNNS
jgi:glutaredoxin-like YruB-family protein